MTWGQAVVDHAGKAGADWPCPIEMVYVDLVLFVPFVKVVPLAVGV